VRLKSERFEPLVPAAERRFRQVAGFSFVVVSIFRSRLRTENADEFGELAARMLALAEAMPGFISYKVYASEDGERCSIIEFESPEHLRAWREHPQHREAQRIGRERYYEEYTLHVGEPMRESRFRR
jgi:heme-degrading monooxygenase HmoA